MEDATAQAKVQVVNSRVGSVEVGEHEDVEQFGAGSRAERVQAFP
jgi:hypothetical protein